jgi:glyoxylase-like metal-dependent hydrolase (beta-lactamase superfamily II)
MPARLPVADQWYQVTAVNDRLQVITEPHVHPFLRANIWHVRGSRRDLVIDAGLGVLPLRATVPQLFERDPALVLTHAHLDHMGGSYEFDSCYAHQSESAQSTSPGSLRGQRLASILGLNGPYPGQLPEMLIDAAPYTGFDPDSYELRPLRSCLPLNEGDTIDLGDTTLTALHLPGHSPGSVALFQPDEGWLFSGDVVYDLAEGEELLDGMTGGNVRDYIDSLNRIAGLPISVVYPGHGAPFGRQRLLELAHDHMESRRALHGPR